MRHLDDAGANMFLRVTLKRLITPGRHGPRAGSV